MGVQQTVPARGRGIVDAVDVCIVVLVSVSEVLHP